MDTFFRRHFRLKGAQQCQYRRPAVAVPTSKARRRSSVGLPSAGLVQRRRSSVGLPFTGPVGRRRSSAGLSPTSQAQRRRSSVGLPSGYVGRRSSSVGLACTAHQQRRRSSEVQGLLQATGGQCCYGGGQLVRTRYYTRRRSSTTMVCVNPRFSVRRRRAAKHRTIDTHLLGPSMLLASLVQMSAEQQRGTPGAQGVEGASGEGTESCPSSSCCSESEGDSCSQRECSTRSEGSGSEQEGTEASSSSSSSSYPEGERTSPWQDWNQAHSMAALTMESIQSRPLIRAPRCLRRNSSHLLPAEAVHRSRAAYGVHGRYRRSSQLRRPSTISNSAWQGRLVPAPNRRSSIVARHSSRSLYRNCSACWKPRGRRESLSPLQGTYYDPRLETWSGFVSYVDPLPSPGSQAMLL